MRILVCIDDTDNLESVGTGEIASMIANGIEKRGWGKCSKITRHQLFVHDDIPYTSHNSAMCFAADIRDDYLDEVIGYASDFLSNESAEGSDPGLCVVKVNEQLKSEKLIHFGKKAKHEIIHKKEAYDLARQLSIHLSEHGGTGQGIIGALAGSGLRLSGNDGRFKGKIKLGSHINSLLVKDILDMEDIDIVKDIDGDILRDDETVELEETLKTVLLDGKSTLLVYREKDEESGIKRWKTCTKQQLKQF